MVLMVKTRVVQHHLETRDGETSIVILVWRWLGTFVLSTLSPTKEQLAINPASN